MTKKLNKYIVVDNEAPNKVFFRGFSDTDNSMPIITTHLTHAIKFNTKEQAEMIAKVATMMDDTIAEGYGVREITGFEHVSGWKFVDAL